MYSATSISPNATIFALFDLIQSKTGLSRIDAMLKAKEAEQLCLKMIHSGKMQSVNGHPLKAITSKDTIYAVGLPGIGIEGTKELAEQMVGEVDETLYSGTDTEFLPMGKLGMFIIKRNK